LTVGTLAPVVTQDLRALGARVASASRQLARAESATRAAAIERAAASLRAAKAEILSANEADLDAAQRAGLSRTALDRLVLDEARLEAMASGLETVASLPDPLGHVVAEQVRPNGLRVRQVRVPLGVVGVIYENRPNVTSDVAGLCWRSGNAAFLRGSSSALGSNRAIVAALKEGLAEVGLPTDAVALVEDTSHEVAVEFMRLRGLIDVLIPRGGPSLINSMLEHATVPFVLDGAGNCHLYVDRAADLEMATSIIVNAKVQRPGVCNAVESLVLHAEIAEELLNRLALVMAEVRLLGDERAQRLSASVEPATEEDFATEFLDLTASVAVVDSLEEAMAHIARYGTGHTEGIITSDDEAAAVFLAQVDAAAVVRNASTRFVDGSELGLGAEVGISTQKLHARGPMGLEALTSVRWVLEGEGQIRT
jgi:glutamate-5-semialdehyde dehydrogenase